jgi:putative iron-regulated protein
MLIMKRFARQAFASGAVLVLLAATAGLAGQDARAKSAAPSRAAVVEHYAALAHAVYSDSLATAKTLRGEIEGFIASPNERTLAAAKAAWKRARVPYQQSEAFRFGNPVVDDWEGKVNAWPLDEGLIDYVDPGYQFEEGNPGAKANVIATNAITVGTKTVSTATITPDLIESLNEIGGSEANVATGYHAIEFLLWGQDLNGTGPGAGNRPYTDYIQTDAGCTNGKQKAGSKNTCVRRAQYLKAATDLLVQDLSYIVDQWAPAGGSTGGNYRTKLVSGDADAGLRAMLYGMGSLSLGELAGERMKVALLANSTEDEHDCFSDNTHHSHYYDALGIRNVYLGEYQRVDGSTLTGPSLSQLVASVDPAADKALRAKLDTTQQRLGAMVDSAEKRNQAFDQMIRAGNVPGHALVRAAINALVEQTGSIEQVAGVIGITELKPDTADHKF